MIEVHHGKLAEFNKSIPDGMVDVFVCCASFEDRCLSIARSLDPARVGVAIIAVNETYWGVVETAYRSIETIFAGKHSRLSVFSQDPILSADNIAAVILKTLVGVPKRILLDITTFTRESLLILLAFLRSSMRSEDRLWLAYAHAKEYSVGDPPELKWLSKGVLEIRSVLAFPGLMVPSRKTHMIILVGFEDERALEMIRESEPSFISLGIGDARDVGTAPHQPTNLHRFKKLRSILGPVDEFTFQAYDPEMTKSALSQQAAKHPECNVVVAPMNTKISTIGAAIFAFENIQVQLCYAPAVLYNVSQYSSPDEDFYLFELPGFATPAGPMLPTGE